MAILIVSGSGIRGPGSGVRGPGSEEHGDNVGVPRE
jgi:hypothetical protein